MQHNYCVCVMCAGKGDRPHATYGMCEGTPDNAILHVYASTTPIYGDFYFVLVNRSGPLPGRRQLFESKFSNRSKCGGVPARERGVPHFDRFENLDSKSCLRPWYGVCLIWMVSNGNKIERTIYIYMYMDVQSYMYICIYIYICCSSFGKQQRS